ncbi:MAG: sigma-70 family RNA polymerase sigma factor [Phycisphaeraceae bacterium]|nr:sigma-70 family RNA polymerase sigma factor [Phycisphaeraceae bacterium]
MHSDDRQLLVGIARGRDDCARELWSRHGPGLTALARAIVGASAAGDVVQSALCRILEVSTWRLSRVEHVQAWLTTLVRREAANFLRAEKRRRVRDREPRVAVNEIAADAGGIWGAVDNLPRRFREVIVLKLIAGLSFEQLALSLGINPNTAAARYRSAIESLRESARVEDRVLSLRGTGHG